MKTTITHLSSVPVTPATPRIPAGLAPNPDERRALRDLAGGLNETDIHAIVQSAVSHALSLNQGTADVLATASVRMETLNRMRRAAREWLNELLAGSLGETYVATLRNEWLPRILAGGNPGQLGPTQVVSFIDHVQGFVAGLVASEPCEDATATGRQIHAWHRTLDWHKSLFARSEA